MVAAAANRDGVLVVDVEPLSCAANLVLKGDILMSVDGVRVSEAGDVVFRGQCRTPLASLTKSSRAPPPLNSHLASAEKKVGLRFVMFGGHAHRCRVESSTCATPSHHIGVVC
jgi:hypothetical protein